MDPLLRAKRDDILRIAASHGATGVRVFGSAARGELRGSSDVDFLVRMDGATLVDHVALIQDLTDLLGRAVDVVAESALHWCVRDEIMREAVAL